MAGLRAQVERGGGCYPLSNSEIATRTFTSPFFPGVTFAELDCIREHGDTARAFAATDSSGQVFVLDSRSAFSFLTRLHPPRGLDSTSAIEYVRLGCVFSGQLPDDARLIFRPSDVPTEVLRRTGAKPGVSRVDRWDGRVGVVDLDAYTRDAIFWTNAVFVDLRTGAMTCGVDEHAAEGRRVH
jgi:hypothetical protein